MGSCPRGFSPPEAGAVSRNFAARLCWRAQGSLHGEGRREPKPSRVTCFICGACVNAQRRCSAAHMLPSLHRWACQDAARRAAPRPSVPAQMFEVNKHGHGVLELPRCWAGLRGAQTDPAPLLTAPRASAAPTRGVGEASLASVCAGGVGEGGEQGCGDFSASHSSKHDINSTDCFWLLFVRVWNLLAASTETWL